MYKGGDRFIMGSNEYMLCSVGTRYNYITDEDNAVYMLINLYNGNRHIDYTMTLDEITKYILDKKFQYKHKCDNQNQHIKVKCNVEVDESAAQDIIDNIMIKLADEIKKHTKITIE